METITIKEDIKLMYLTAASFPDGVLDAHSQLHSIVPFSKDRKYFGLSRPEKKQIVYKAATEELQEGEAEKLGLNSIVLKRGQYLSITVHDFMKDIQSIGEAFMNIAGQPGLDPQGYCVELYLNDKDVQCMVRLAD